MGVVPRTVQKLEKIWHLHPQIQKIYSAPYRWVVQREARMAEINREDRVLSLGCGAIPFSAIFLKEYSGAPVWALDIDAQALEKAGQLLRKNGIRGITLLQGNGAEIDLSQFTVILVALQVEPKKGVLKNFFAGAPEGARLIMRSPRHLFVPGYDPLPPTPQPCQRISQPLITFGGSVLYYNKK